MPHIPPQIDSFGGGETDTAWLYQTKESGEIVIPPPSLPERSASRKSIILPPPASYQHHQRYLSSLSDASTASTDSNASSDDDDRSPILTTSTVGDRARTKEFLNSEQPGTEDENEIGDEGSDVHDDDYEDFEELEPYQETILAHENRRGSIAVVISYVFVGKPKIVDIPESPRFHHESPRLSVESPRYSEDGRRRSIESKSSISPTSFISGAFCRWKDAVDRKRTASPPTPDRSEVTTPTGDIPSPFISKDGSTTTTVCYAENPLKENNISGWQGLVRSLSTAKRKASPKKPSFEVNRKLAPIAAVEEEPPKKIQRRPLGLTLTRPRSTKMQTESQKLVSA